MSTDPMPIHRRDALAEGVSDTELRRLYTREGWTKLSPGFYLPPSITDELDDADRHRALVEAKLTALAPDAVVSHQSAVVMHGLPVWNVDLDRVHVTRSRSGGGARSRQLHVHCAPLADADHVDRVVTPARAFVDVARTQPFEEAVVVGDATARKYGYGTTDFANALAYAEGWRGYRAAVRAIEFVDARSESVGESRSRVLLAKLHFPAPQLQTEFYDADGFAIGRSDFFFEESGVIGEFDGKVKYGKYLRAGETSGDAVYREKVREDRLRDMGWEVVRWTWADLARPEVIRARIQRAIDRRKGSPRPVGRFALAG